MIGFIYCIDKSEASVKQPHQTEAYGAPFQKKLVTFMDIIFKFCTTSKYFSCDTKLF